MKYAKHTGNEHTDLTRTACDDFSGTLSRRRLIPETDTERALLVEILKAAEMRSTHRGYDQALTFSAGVPEGLEPESAGWFGCTYSVTDSDPLKALTGEVVVGYACITEHPHRDHPHRFQVWHHIPPQDGCPDGACGAGHYPVVRELNDLTRS